MLGLYSYIGKAENNPHFPHFPHPADDNETLTAAGCFANPHWTPHVTHTQMETTAQKPCAGTPLPLKRGGAGVGSVAYLLSGCSWIKLIIDPTPNPSPRKGRGVPARGWEIFARGWERFARGWENFVRGWENFARGWEIFVRGWEGKTSGLFNFEFNFV